MHTDFVRPLTRYARTVRQPELVLQELDEAVSRAFGQGGEPGPVYLDFPVDTLRAEVPRALLLPEQMTRRAAPAHAARPRCGAARRSTCCRRRSGRCSSPAAARAAPGRSWRALLDRLGALYLDTGESRGLVADDHPRWWRRCAAR